MEDKESHFEDLLAEIEFNPEGFEVTGGIRVANLIIDTIVYYGVYLGLIYTGILTMENPFMIYFVLLIYYITVEGLTGRSVGKLITGTKVVTEEGKTPKFSNFIGRSFCRMIPFDAISFLMKNNRGWHDTVSKTWVVKNQFPTAE